MRSHEGVDMMKWAIAILLLCLLIGTTLAFFYMLYDNTDRRIDSMQKAATSSNMDRLHDLRDATLTHEGDIGRYPLCTNIISVLKEFSEEDLLYIQVVTPNSSESVMDYVFTYTGTNISGDSTVRESDIPVTEACRFMLAYSDCRAELSLGKFDISGSNTNVSSGTDWSAEGSGLLCIKVVLYVDPQVQ